MVAIFQLEGQEFLALDGGPHFKWLTVEFGLTWQIVPSILGELMSDEDDEKSGRGMQAMLQMVKLDIKKLQAACHGK